MDITAFTTTALLGFALWQGQNLIRYLRALDWNGTVGIILAWGMGFGIAEWAANSAITAKLELVTGAPALGLMDVGSLALLGLGLGSAGGAFADFLKSRDNTQSAVKPLLVEPAGKAA